MFLGMPSIAHAVEYRCPVEQKFDSERIYTRAQIKKFKYSVLIEDYDTSAFLSRCSGDAKVSCDRYEVDKIAYDEYVKIKKYYVFRSQFDVQLFPNLSFVENNGRGGIAYGTCAVASP
jgi:hypothetical protein